MPFLNLAELGQGPDQLTDGVLEGATSEIGLEFPQAPARVDVRLYGRLIGDAIAAICYGEQD